MKKITRRIVALFITFIMCFQFGTIDSKADASVSIALSSSSVSIGGGVTATISVSGSDISAYTIYVSYDSSILQFNSASGSAQANGGGGTLVISGTGAGSVSASFTAIANGTASISTSGSEVYNINLEQIAISHAGVSVTVATAGGNDSGDGNNDSTTEGSTEDTDDGKSSNCNLASLQISPGTLEPAFSPDTTSYYVKVDEDVTSMVVSAATEDSKASTDVWGAGLIEPGENTVRITVTAENGAVKVYNIRVVAGEDLGDAVATIDNVLYTFVDDASGLEVPEGFSETKLKYKEWEVLAFEAPSKKVKIVCMTDENNEYHWFIYDEKTDSFIPYNEYSANFNRYIILPVPEGVAVPEGFEERSISINNNKITAYQSANIEDKNIYLIYAVNIAGGEGFYMYDTVEASFMRYVPMIVVDEKLVYATPTEATPTDVPAPVVPDDGFFTRQVLIYFLCGAGALLAILIICLIAFGSRIRNLNEELERADGMVSELASAKDTVNHEALAGNRLPADDRMPDVDALVAEIDAIRQQTNSDAPVSTVKLGEDYDASKDSAFANDEEEESLS